MWKKAFALLQQMGKSLMLPVSVLPIAGLLLGLGSARSLSPEKFWFIPEFLGKIMKDSGEAIFANLPLIFAIAVAIGFTANDGVSALAAVVGFAVFLATLGAASTELWGVSAEKLKPVMGISTLDTGVFGGLILGCLAAYLFNRFFRIQLPQYLGFFAGKRFVPIITGLSAIALGLAMSVIWPPIGNAISQAADAAASGGNVAITAAIYGFVERLLLPFGLHHIWNVPFFFQIGSFVNPTTGKVVTGDIQRFFSGDPTAGILGGAYWFKMFGLPAAAIAIWHSAKPEKRKVTGGLMLSAAFTSFLTGITEPIEFSFMFVAVPLYLIHACLASFADWLFVTLGGRMGFTFSQGFIDFILFSGLPNAQRVWLIPVLGLLVFAPLYYVVFRFGIQYFNFQTPGREEDDPTTEAGVAPPGQGTELSRELVRAFGGRHNIAVLDACITRLRITVNDKNKVNKGRLKALGASGVLEVGDSVQAIFGPRSENLKTDMIDYLKVAGPEADQAYSPSPVQAAAEAAEEATSIKLERDPEAAQKMQAAIAALGGASNIRDVDDVAMTRLRLELASDRAIDEAALKNIGIEDIMHLSENRIHLLVGLNADQYAEEMKKQLAKV
jgi:glucose PTS system EIICB or EIICBA component